MESRQSSILLTPAETIAVLQRIDALLDTIGHHLAKLSLAGPLNLEQVERMRFALAALANLQRLFTEERARLANVPATSKGA
jgi:hypothetical protein